MQRIGSDWKCDAKARQGLATLGTAKDKQREDTTCSGKAMRSKTMERRGVDRLSKGKAKLCNTLKSKGEAGNGDDTRSEGKVLFRGVKQGQRKHII